MRIISGLLKGKKLISPDGQGTRPTSDKARQGIFNIIEHAPWSNGIKDANFLDICAGTGAFGLEALSRGAKFSYFIENNKSALNALKENIKNCRFENKTKIIDANILSLPKITILFDIIFIDPPYFQNLITPVLKQIIEKKYIGTSSIIIIEHHKDEEILLPENYLVLKKVNYGINGITFLKIEK